MFQISTFSASFRDLEEDPLFGDEVPPDSRPPNSDWFSLSPPQSPDHPKNDGKTEVHKIVNRWANSSSYSGGWGGLQGAGNVQLTFCCSFLCLVPDEAKSSYQVEGTGYDTYLRDAHRQVSASAQQQQKDFFSEDSQCEWMILLSLRTIVVFAYTGTGGEAQSLLRSAIWTFRSSKAISWRFSSTGWAAFLIRSVGSAPRRIGTFIAHTFI